jgi:glycosyltransferase involved in cell wall biosynthesis
MKIVCIAASIIPSKTANSIQVMKVADAMAVLGHQVILCVPGEKDVPWEGLNKHYGLQSTFEIQWIPENQAFKRYDFALKAVRSAERMKPDLIYTWMIQSAVIALWHKIPTVLEMHDRVTGRLGPWLFRQFWRASTTKRLLTITQALRQVLTSDFQLPKDLSDQIMVAPDGVDLDRYQGLSAPAEHRQQLNLENKFTAGYTGHFYEGRGIDLMFHLAKNLSEINFLWVGGDPGDVSRWRDRIKSEQVANITLTGFVDNAILPKYQAACDVLLMPYSSQISGSSGGNTAQIASPMKMFEYMAAGRPIISSDLPVIREVLNDQTAIFCAPDDLTDWQNALMSLHADPVMQKRFGENAREAVTAYTWQTRIQKALENFL